MIRIFLMGILFSLTAQGLELQFLNQATLPNKLKFQKSLVGGISALSFDSTTGEMAAVCDDRGMVNEPRLYQFAVKATEKEFKVDPKSVTWLSYNMSEKSHESTKSKTKNFTKVLDMEGMALAPWGDFLLTNEGDMNHRPRVNPQILSVKPDGDILREFPLPEKFLAEISGEQKKGMQNNLAFEGLAGNPNGKEWVAASEGSLVQDNREFVRFLQLQSPEAFVLKAGKEWAYPLSPGKALQRGVSDLLFLDDTHVLVLERALSVSSSGLGFEVELYLVDLSAGTDISDLASIPKEGLPKGKLPLVKKQILDLKNLEKDIGRIENYEGMTLGPKLSDGRRTLILVSDDNFMRDLKTKFLLFKMKE